MDRDAFRQQQLAKLALDSSEQLLQPTNSAARDSSSTMPASPAWASMKVETASPSERPELAPPMTRHSLPAPPQVPQAQGSNEHQLPAPPAPQPSRAHRRTNPVCQVDGCKEDLSDEKYKVYHRRNRICDEHFKCLVCFHKGQNMRYCQQCHKFHEIDAFDFGKHSCRAKLQKRAGKGQRAAAALSAADREHESQRMRGGQDASDTSGLGLSMTDASSSASLAMDSEASLSLMPGGLATRLGFGGGQSGMQVGLGGTWRGLQASQLQPGGTWTPSVGGLLSTDASQRQLLQQQQQQVHFAGHMMSVDPAGNLLDRQGSILSAMSNATSADASFGSLAEWRHLQALQQQQQQQQQQLMLQRQVSQVPRADLGGAFTLPSLGHGLGSGLPRGDLALLGFDTALSQAVRREEEMQQAMGQLQAQLQQQQQAEQQQRQLLLLQQQQQQQQQQLLQAQQGTGLGSMAFTLQRGPARVGSRGSGADELMSTFDIDGRSSAGSVGNLALHGTWAENELERLSRERQRQQPAPGSAGTSAEDLAVQHLRLQRGFSGVQDLTAQQQQQQQHTLLGSTQVQQVAPGASMLHALDPQTFALQQQRLWHATQPGSGQAQGTHMLHAQNTSMAPALLASAPGQRQGSPTDQRPNRMLSDIYAARGWQPDQPGL